MSGLTRMHFQAVAKILGENNASHVMVEDFMDYFGRMNPRFDRHRFEKEIERITEEIQEEERKRNEKWFLENHDEVSPGLWVDKKTIFERLKESEDG